VALKKRETQKAEAEKLVKAMRRWQTVEDESIRMTKAIQAKTDNPLVRLVMEIIAHDSAMHRRVQQFIIDSVETSPIQLSPEDLEKIWDHVAQHIAEEKKTLELADEARTSTRFFVQRYLLNYLLEDERKHDLLLERLEEVKNRIYPYA